MEETELEKEVREWVIPMVIVLIIALLFVIGIGLASYEKSQKEAAKVKEAYAPLPDDDTRPIDLCASITKAGHKCYQFAIGRTQVASEYPEEVFRVKAMKAENSEPNANYGFKIVGISPVDGTNIYRKDIDGDHVYVHGNEITVGKPK